MNYFPLYSYILWGVFMARRKENNKYKNKIVSEFFIDEPKIEMSGNREMIVDGCKGVVEYDETMIKLSLGDSVISILGDSLVIQSFDSSVAIINGTIIDISFE